MEGNNAAVDPRGVKPCAGPLPRAAAMESAANFASAGTPGFLGRFYYVFGAPRLPKKDRRRKGGRYRRPRCRLAASDAPPCHDGAPRYRRTTKLGVALALVTVFPCRDLFDPRRSTVITLVKHSSIEQLRPT